MSDLTSTVLLIALVGAVSILVCRERGGLILLGYFIGMAVGWLLCWRNS